MVGPTLKKAKLWSSQEGRNPRPEALIVSLSWCLSNALLNTLHFD